MILELTILDFGKYKINQKLAVFAFVASTVHSGESRNLHLRVLIPSLIIWDLIHPFNGICYSLSCIVDSFKA